MVFRQIQNTYGAMLKDWHRNYLHLLVHVEEKKKKCSLTQCVVKLYSSLILDVGVLKVSRNSRDIWRNYMENKKAKRIVQFKNMTIVSGCNWDVNCWRLGEYCEELSQLVFLATYTVICSWHLNFTTVGRGIIREMNLWPDPL